jgi:hypothetical protein
MRFKTRTHMFWMGAQNKRNAKLQCKKERGIAMQRKKCAWGLT